MDIRDAALKYLASRARTCGEMEKHLQDKGFEAKEIGEIIKNFVELHYLDDMDYCIRYFDFAFRKGRGVLRVKRELEEKGVPRQTIDIAYEDYGGTETELERAKGQAEKIVSGREIDQKLLAKIGRRLTAMGFSSDVIYKVIGMYMRD